MQFQSLQCSVCFYEYDLANHLPRILPQCGHTMCTQCLITLLHGSNVPKCPLDNKSFNAQQKKVDTFPVNFSLRGILEEKLDIELCSAHGNPVEFICQNDQSKLCSHCALFGGHKDHALVSAKSTKSEINNRKKELEFALENLNRHHRELDKTLEEKKALLMKTIEDSFEHFIGFAKKKKMELAVEVNTFFSKERNRLDHHLGSKSAMSNTIRNKIMELKEIVVPKAQDVEEKLLQCILEFDFESFKKNLQNIKAKITETSNSLSATLSNQASALDHLEFSTKDISDQIKALYPQSVLDFKQESFPQAKQPRVPEPAAGESLSLFTSLEVLEFSGLLQIKAANSSPKAIKLKTENLRNVTTLKLSIEKIMLEGELDVLHLICKELQYLNTVKIMTSNQQSISQSYLIDLFETIFANPYNMRELSLNLRYSTVTDGVIASLSEKILPQMPNLKCLHLFLRETVITDHSLHVFTGVALPRLDKLEEFRIDLRSTLVTREGIVQLFVEMPTVKVLELGLSSLDIRDEELEVFIRRTLKSMVNLDILEMFLYKTRISNEIVRELFIRLPDLSRLTLDLHSTATGDSSVKYLLEDKLPAMKGLRSLNLELSRTRVTDRVKAEIWKITGSLSGC